MSYHFQPQGDSSGEEEQVNLSAWQSAPKSKGSSTAQQAPVVPSTRREVEDDNANNGEMPKFLGATDAADAAAVGSDEDTAADAAVEFAHTNEENDSDPLRVSQPTAVAHASSNRERQPRVSFGFTAINNPVTTSINDEEEEPTLRSTVPAKRKLVPVIPRGEVDANERVEFEDFTSGGDVVRRVLKESRDRDGYTVYEVEFENWGVRKIPFDDLLAYENGQSALNAFESQPTPESAPEPSRRRGRSSNVQRGRKNVSRPGFASTVDAISASEDEGSDPRRGKKRKRTQHIDYEERSEEAVSEDEVEYESEDGRFGKGRRTRSSQGTTRQLRSRNQRSSVDDLEDDDESGSGVYLESDLIESRRRKRRLSLRGPKSRGYEQNGPSFDKGGRQGQRQSGRANRHQGGMQEIGENEIYRSDSDDGLRPLPKPRAVGAREQFKTLPRNDEFRIRHIQQCETCGQGPNFAPVVYCQGCTLAYHKSCLGPRNTREHLVTKIEGGDSVLQCRRCVGFARVKDPTAPDQGKCSDCHVPGNACMPFRARKTTVQEQKERDSNDGEDPVYDVDPSRINQAGNVMFRCLNCWRAFHFEHLPSRSDLMDLDTDVDAEQRFREYSRDWQCKDCLDMPAKVSGLIAWKPIDEDSYDPAVPLDAIQEDEKAYLIKWHAMSYFRACWMPGAWVWGVTGHAMRKAFAMRDDAQHPKMRTEDAIPEDYLRADIVLDIKYTSIVEVDNAEVDKARVREIDKALIKYKGLGYKDAVWEAPPQPDDGERWSDFLMAYNDWILGRHLKVPKPSTIRARIEKARNQDFAKLEKKAQPDNVEGGQLMQYQIEGLNWLYYKWFTQKNVILADEMGLGKTIQIIGFLATLVADWTCFPFLVVVPNSTVPNWRREIKRWAPSLRVVTYYGDRESRELEYKYELFPDATKDMRCHVLVTSYDAAADESFRRLFKNVSWQGLVVDEGQRLKNDKGLLYSALGLLKVPFKILLTGTPLQNNQRELFNLLHFLDDSKDADQLEQEFAELDTDKIAKLHDMIRPFFLRRTKAQVLTFLPPMAQIIVPVSMTLVQRKLYRTILAKNPELIKAIFSSDATLKNNERAGLNNMLMQLRKCLCHPFVYSKSIEERNVSHAMSHRNLVDASAKLKFLEQLLPRLRERGHRVLIFSQFLDMLDIVEDFMDGMEFPYQRLDGSITSLQKQKRIDEFNAPDSPLFAFLLSTRAGGVGINLASADTVIILDPDFNPHQDIQALSRAHRIGQHRKVLCFQLVTRASSEERIMQMGRKKLALDHVLIREMDADDADQNDLIAILRHGAAEIFDDSGDQDIVYDGASIDRLLDRSQMEDTQAGVDKSAETQFSVARVWANDQGTLQDDALDGGDEGELQAPNPDLWSNILKERERIAAEESAAKADAYGRGRRVRTNVDYNNEGSLEGADGIDITPNKPRKHKIGDDSDTDFQASEADDEAEDEGEDGEVDKDLVGLDANRATGHKKSGKHNPSRSTNPKRLGPPTPVATPKSKTPGLTVIKPARKPRAPKASPEQVKKPRGAVGEVVKNGVKTPKKPGKAQLAATPAKEKQTSGAGPSTSPKKGKAATGQASASPVKKPAEQPPAPWEGAVGAQHFNNAGSPADPIVLGSDDEDAKSLVIAPQPEAGASPPVPSNADPASQQI